MQDPFVRVLGSADWLPTPENDGASYTLNDRILIDTGWSCVTNMINHHIDPLQMHTICFTHMHADHYMALPQLILYWRIHCHSLEALTIIGPEASVEEAFQRAFHYVFHDAHDVQAEVRGMPTILPLRDGDMLNADDFTIRVCASHHAAPGLCYRFEHHPSHHTVCFSGDTAYRPEFASFYHDCDLLVHESSFGIAPTTPQNNAICKHSSAMDAARVAKEANAKAMLLTHSLASRRQASVDAARALLDIPVAWAMPGECFPY
ncbi:MAG: MBL fold metallo-hydrolase [Clostridia bacterium]